jgi:hypothetical protein
MSLTKYNIFLKQAAQALALLQEYNLETVTRNKFCVKMGKGTCPLRQNPSGEALGTVLLLHPYTFNSSNYIKNGTLNRMSFHSTYHSLICLTKKKHKNRPHASKYDNYMYSKYEFVSFYSFLYVTLYTVFVNQ